MKKKIKVTIDDCIVKITKRKKGTVKINNYLLTENDRLTYIYSVDSQREIAEVVNVSYELLINNKWITIVRFDSNHGYLHRHMRISLHDPNTIVDSTNIIKKGNPANWLSWAIKFTNKNYYQYKVGFCRRSKIRIIDI